MSSHRGSHQARSPSSAITAGTSVMRTQKASIATPTARAKAICLMELMPSGTKNANTENMITAAATTTGPDAAMPSRIASTGFLPCTYSSRIRETRNTS